MANHLYILLHEMNIGKIVYCVDKNSPYYGKRLKVDVTSEDGKTLSLSDMTTGKAVRINAEQIGTAPPIKRS